jgi:hypothetical protein
MDSGFFRTVMRAFFRVETNGMNLAMHEREEGALLKGYIY